MRTAIFTILIIAFGMPVFAQGDFAVTNPAPKKLPADVILVKGAVASSSDPSVPAPEGGAIAQDIYTNKYFGMSYRLPAGFQEKYSGPPPSDSGYYVLAELEPKPQFQAAAAGSVLISAQDLFFGLTPADSPQALVEFRLAKLGPYFRVERQPTQIKLGSHSFLRFDYTAPDVGLHWYTLTTQVRCHAVQFQFTSRDPQLAESMVQQLANIALGNGSNAPVCVKNYAVGENVLHKVDPVFTDRKFNPIPVRIVIDKYGKVKYVHVISAFPDQLRAITDALLQWEFRPYRLEGRPVEVETGILFGSRRMPKPGASSARVAD